MFCGKCGKPLADDVQFCSHCGAKLNVIEASPENSSNITIESNSSTVPPVTPQPSQDIPHTKRVQPAKKKKNIIWIIAAMAIALTIGIVALNSDSSTPNTDESSVRDGYLGEYTDISVGVLLDTYYCDILGYDSGIWDSGETDVGKQIVEVRYPAIDEIRSEVTIQFTMLNDECFYVSAYVDPLEEIDKATDLLRTLNYLYFSIYGYQHSSETTDPAVVTAFVQRLDTISASHVQYGASAAFSGDRCQISTNFGQEPLDVSVAMLLDSYGLLDMEEYLPGKVDPDIESPADTPLAAFQAVLSGESPFHFTESNSLTYIDSLTKFCGSNFAAPLSLNRFCVVDFDRDGTSEVVAELASSSDGWILVLRYYEGQVYGYGYTYRAMLSIQTDGTYYSSGGAIDGSSNILIFNGADCSVMQYAASNHADDVIWHDCSEQAIADLSLNSAHAEFPPVFTSLDFYGGTYYLETLHCSIELMNMPYINQMYISLLDEAQNCFDYGEIVLGETCSLKNGATILVTPLANGNVLLDLETAAGRIKTELIK